MDHSLEEIRQAAFHVLRANNTTGSQFLELRRDIAAHFSNVDPYPLLQTGIMTYRGRATDLTGNDADLFVEVFWGLFREGIITLGRDESNVDFPFFRLTGYGRKILDNSSVYFFTDVTDYERMLRERIHNIDTVTMLYLNEAVQTFKIGAVLASSVMVGVASEHTFNLMVDTVEANAVHNTLFQKVFKETKILPRMNAFKKILDNNPTLLTSDIKEDLDTRFNGILSLIRDFRNEAGHPTGKIILREQAYINLQLFIPYAEKVYQLREHFEV